MKQQFNLLLKCVRNMKIICAMPMYDKKAETENKRQTASTAITN